jgi:hypothetical protein
MFQKSPLKFTLNLFENLTQGVVFENITHGRKGAVLVDVTSGGEVPLVRSNNLCHGASQQLSKAHKKIRQIILEYLGQTVIFNNVLIEQYDEAYTKMRYHSDQELDLDPSSTICIFTCYNDPFTTRLRKLRIQNKVTNKVENITLYHNSLVTFSAATNREYWHKIILEGQNERKKPSEGQNTTIWLGLTFRTSKTFLYFDKKSLPHFTLTHEPLTCEPITLANTTQIRNFCKQTREQTDTCVPFVTYTFSPGDLKPIPLTLYQKISKNFLRLIDFLSAIFLFLFSLCVCAEIAAKLGDRFFYLM